MPIRGFVTCPPSRPPRRRQRPAPPNDARRTSRPAPGQRHARCSRSPSSSRTRSRAPRDRVHVERVDEESGLPGDLLGRRPRGGHHRGSVRHRFEHRQPEPLSEARVDERGGAGVQGVEFIPRDEAQRTDPVMQGGHPVGRVLLPSPRAGEHEIEIRSSDPAERLENAVGGSSLARGCRRTGRTADRARTGRGPGRPSIRRPGARPRPTGRAGDAPARSRPPDTRPSSPSTGRSPASRDGARA